MIERILRPELAYLFVALAAAFGGGAGYQLGGGVLPLVPAVADEFLYVIAISLFGVGALAILIAQPDVIGRIGPTSYIIIAMLPLLRFGIPGVLVLRFIPLALIAPVVYGLYRDAEEIRSHTRLARFAVFAAGSITVTSVVANRGSTDVPRLLLLLGGIVLLVGAAPRAWSATWQDAVVRAIQILFWAVAISTFATLGVNGSFLDDRLRGVFFSATTLGALLALTTPLAAARSRIPIVHWAIAFALSIAAGSRGGLLALTAAAAIVLIHRRRFFVLATAAAIGVLVFSTGVIRTQSDHEVTLGVNTREIIWDQVLDGARESPLIGHGFGSVAEFDYSLESQLYIGQSPEVHSSWVETIYEQGLFSAVFWFGALVAALVASFRSGPAWFATVVAGLISATFESWMFSLGGGLGSLFWIVVGAAALGPGREDPVEIDSDADEEGDEAKYRRLRAEEILRGVRQAGSRDKRSVFELELGPGRSK